MLDLATLANTREGHPLFRVVPKMWGVQLPFQNVIYKGARPSLVVKTDTVKSKRHIVCP